MNLNITTRGFDITDSIRSYIQNAVTKHVEKYFNDDNSINIKTVLTHDVFDKYTTHFIINDDHGEFINIVVDSKDAYSSIDAAVACLNAKLRKYKEKIVYYRNKKFRKQSEKAKSYLLKNNLDIENFYVEDHNEHDDSRIVIEEYDVPLKKMSVKDAVMDMDLHSLPALLFINIRTNIVNMIYTRKDGHIGWVEPSLKI